MAAASPFELHEIHYKKLGGQPVKIVTAAGPYTLNDNLLFEPFAALMDHVNKERPDILLLVRIHTAKMCSAQKSHPSQDHRI